jgi:pimeloyl-ACP methyl ester carboxylesterase
MAAREFKRETLTVNGVKVVMLTVGNSGEPLLFLHGAGTWHGFDFALPWASDHRVMIPYHPGWGDSGDAPDNPTVHDYTMHYLELIDQLGLERVNLVGLSMGGRIAATFTVEHRRRVRRLVLLAPAGLEVPGHPNVDFSRVPPEEIPSYLVEDLRVLAPYLPKEPSAEFQAARAREGASFNRLLKAGLVGPWLARWLHRVNMPTLVVWGEKDRTIPVGQADVWAKLIPHAEVRRFPEAGHLVLDEKPEAVQAVADFLASTL